MKRAHASPNLDKHADNSVHTSDCASKRRKSGTPPLTQDTLSKLHCTTEPRSLHEWKADCVQSILRWVDKCESSDELEMPPSPIPSITASRDNRRTAKLVQRQRSSSPVKKSNSPQYRAINMADANVFVDHFPEAPATIDEQLARVFGGLTWAASQQESIEELARQYCEESRVLAKECAGENEWRSQLFSGLLKPLSRIASDILMLSASGKPWLSELKPTAPSLYDFIPRPTPILQQGVPQPQTQSTASVLPNTPVFNMPSSAPSDVSSGGPNGLTTPKPDIALGLAHTSFTRIQRTVLIMLQDDCRVLSEPHQAQIGLRFPFLIIETKGGAAGGNLIGAQNQAAVDGACALNILGDLRGIFTRIMSQQDNPGTEQGGDDEMPDILFSVTTEGPIHEIWVHYRVGETYHMTCYRAWRTTQREDAREFVQALARIAEWGRIRFRDSVLNLLGRVEQAVLAGVLTSMVETSS